MRGHFRYLRFKTFPMTPRTPQCEVFCPLLSSSEHSGVPEDSNSRLFQVLGFTPTLGQSRGATLPHLGHKHYVLPMCGGATLIRSGHFLGMKPTWKIIMPNIQVAWMNTWRHTCWRFTWPWRGSIFFPKTRCLWQWHGWFMQRWCLGFRLIRGLFQAIELTMCLHTD